MSKITIEIEGLDHMTKQLARVADALEKLDGGATKPPATETPKAVETKSPELNPPIPPNPPAADTPAKTETPAKAVEQQQELPVADTPAANATLEQVREALMEVGKVVSPAAAKSCLTTFGVDMLPDLPEEKFGELVKLCNQALADAKAG